jgi:hypothetical protein
MADLTFADEFWLSTTCPTPSRPWPTPIGSRPGERCSMSTCQGGARGGLLGALRMLPEIIGHRLHGERPAKPPQSMRLRDLPSIPMYEGGWILLGERAGHEIALGLLGKFWRPVIEFARITNAEEFRDFDEPGFAKTVYDLSVARARFRTNACCPG